MQFIKMPMRLSPWRIESQTHSIYINPAPHLKRILSLFNLTEKLIHSRTPQSLSSRLWTRLNEREEKKDKKKRQSNNPKTNKLSWDPTKEWNENELLFIKYTHNNPLIPMMCRCRAERRRKSTQKIMFIKRFLCLINGFSERWIFTIRHTPWNF